VTAFLLAARHSGVQRCITRAYTQADRLLRQLALRCSRGAMQREPGDGTCETFCKTAAMRAWCALASAVRGSRMMGMVADSAPADQRRQQSVPETRTRSPSSCGLPALPRSNVREGLVVACVRSSMPPRDARLGCDTPASRTRRRPGHVRRQAFSCSPRRAAPSRRPPRLLQLYGVFSRGWARRRRRGTWVLR
jgi:hypothetical protein